MRIAYVCYWSVFVLDGVAKKISTQTAQWARAGHDVETFALTPGARGRSQRWDARPYPFESVASRTGAAVKLLRDLRRFRPDVVYLRYDLLPPPLHLVTRLHPTVVELNSDDQREYAFRRRAARLSWLYGAWNWRTLYGSAAGIVSVTTALLDLVARFERPSTVIANGIELEGLPSLPAESGERPTIVFSGTPGQDWHGVDKLVDLARARPDIDVSLIGFDPDAGLPPNVTAHGFLERAAYEAIFARADVALGSAALHRKGMSEASPLKLREYLAYGLPVVLPYEDTDLVGVDDWWLLRLPNDEENVLEAADAIVRFAAGVRGRRVPRAEVASRIGAEAKERARLEFFAGLLPPE
jgi:glycosyltransferase involved in cell wall biosynthesis